MMGGMRKTSGPLRDQSRAQGKADQTWNVADVQPLHELGPMVLHGLGTDFENQGNGLGGLAFGDQLQDFALSFGQQVERTAGADDLTQGKFLQQTIGQFAAEINFPGRNASQGGSQLGDGCVLEQVTAAPDRMACHRYSSFS